MSIIQNPEDFQPSEESRKKWLSTRKHPQPIGIVNFPGYYKTDDYSIDSYWFLIALGIELVALIVTIIGGFSKSPGFGIISVIIVILFVFFDILGAKFVHKFVGEIQKIKNKILIENDPTKIEGYYLNIEKYKTSFTVFLGIFLIILSSALKIFAIYVLNHRFPMPLMFIMTISYLLVIYIHIKHTGYWYAEYNLRKSFRVEYEKYAVGKVVGNIDNNNIAAVRKMPFTTNIKLSFESSIFSGPHSITLENSTEVIHGSQVFIYSPNNNGEARVESYSKQEGQFYNYMIKTKGVLTDEDIAGFTQGQNTGQASIIALACLNFQIQNP